MVKIIWMCWFQGEDDPNMPKINKVCIERWKQLNPDWDVRIISTDTIAEYVPRFFKIVKQSKNRCLAHQADLLRLLLLSRYGGVWVDASVYPMLPLTEFYDSIMNDTGFFTYRFFKRGGYRTKKLETVVWFLCTDRPKHHLIDKWKNKFIEKYKNKKNFQYFEFGHSLTELYDTDDEVKYTVDNMIQINQSIPHSACKSVTNRRGSFMYKRPSLKITEV